MMEYFWRSSMPHPELLRLCRLPVWSVEETVALSLGVDPSSISPQRVKAFKNHLGQTALANAGKEPKPGCELPVPIPGFKLYVGKPDSLKEDLAHARLYMARHDHLMRAARGGELPAAPFRESFEIKPLDFLAWYKRQNSQVPWHALPNELTNHFCFDIPSGISGDQRGVFETWQLLQSVMSKPLAERQFATMADFKAHCENTFKIRHRDFEILRTKAINTPGLTSWPTGRPKKAK